jgi:hypothetical protein
MTRVEQLWYVPLPRGNLSNGNCRNLNLIFQSYVSVSPSSTAFYRRDGIVAGKFDVKVPFQSRFLARREYIVDRFGDFSDFQQDKNIDFLVNGAVSAVLDSQV